MPTTARPVTGPCNPMKWTRIAPGRYASGEWSLRQAMWRRTPDGWMIFRGDTKIDSRRRFADAKKTAERLMESAHE